MNASTWAASEEDELAVARVAAHTAVETIYADDIPLDLAIRAHAGTSHVPAERGRQELAAYADRMRGMFSRLFELATAKLLADEFLTAWEAFRSRYRTLVVASLAARSRCLSTMIAGSSNFNVRRAQKANDSADKRAREAEEFWATGMEQLHTLLHPEAQPIRSGDSDAPQRVRAKLAAHAARHATMLMANKHAPGTHESWEIRNSGAEMRRLKAQVSMLEMLKKQPFEVFDGEHGKVEVDPPENRVRLFLRDGEPHRETLKSRGFRWAPSQGCWSAYFNPRTVQLAKDMIGGAV